MTDTKRLNDIIKERGLKKKYLAQQLNLSAYGLARKIDGKSDFRTGEVVALCDILGITKTTDKYDIFFK